MNLVSEQFKHQNWKPMYIRRVSNNLGIQGIREKAMNFMVRVIQEKSRVAGFHLQKSPITVTPIHDCWGISFSYSLVRHKNHQQKFGTCLRFFGTIMLMCRFFVFFYSIAQTSKYSNTNEIFSVFLGGSDNLRKIQFHAVFLGIFKPR